MPTAATNSFRVSYSLLAIAVTVLLALAGGWAASDKDSSEVEKRVAATEITLANHLREDAQQNERTQVAAAAHEKRMSEHFEASQAENAELQKTLTELRIVVARQRP